MNPAASLTLPIPAVKGHIGRVRYTRRVLVIAHLILEGEILIAVRLFDFSLDRS
jgi:hypothetical protein